MRASADVAGMSPSESAPRVESRWWYWVAAVPVHFVLTLLVGGFVFVTFVLGLGFGPRVGLSLGLLAVAAIVLVALPGLALSVLFPLALYLDAQAVTEADVEWSPDPVVYGLIAVAGVVLTAFVVSVPLALYYLYRRHDAVGVP